MCFGSNLRTVTHSLTDMPTSRDAVASKNKTVISFEQFKKEIKKY